MPTKKIAHRPLRSKRAVEPDAVTLRRHAAVLGVSVDDATDIATLGDLQIRLAQRGHDAAAALLHALGWYLAGRLPAMAYPGDAIDRAAMALHPHGKRGRPRSARYLCIDLLVGNVEKSRQEGREERTIVANLVRAMSIWFRHETPAPNVAAIRVDKLEGLDAAAMVTRALREAGIKRPDNALNARRVARSRARGAHPNKSSMLVKA